MATGSFDVQTAVYDVLNDASPGLAAGGVHDGPPDSVTFPYVSLVSSEITTDSVDVDDDGVSEVIAVHVYDQTHRGLKVVKEIASRIHTLLHGTTLTVSGRASALCWVDTILARPEPDRLTHRAIVMVRCEHRN